MAKVVRKKIASSRIEVSQIVVADGIPSIQPLEDLWLNKKVVSMEHAEREVHKAEKYNELREQKARLIVTGFENKEDVYVMDQLEFLKHASIEQPAEQTALELD